MTLNFGAFLSFRSWVMNVKPLLLGSFFNLNLEFVCEKNLLPICMTYLNFIKKIQTQAELQPAGCCVFLAQPALKFQKYFSKLIFSNCLRLASKLSNRQKIFAWIYIKLSIFMQIFCPLFWPRDSHNPKVNIKSGKSGRCPR